MSKLSVYLATAAVVFGVNLKTITVVAVFIRRKGRKVGIANSKILDLMLVHLESMAKIKMLVAIPVVDPITAITANSVMQNATNATK